MSRLNPLMRVPLLAALALGLLAGSASAATVTAGKLDWSTTKIYDTRAPAGTDRTWLGYATTDEMANGTATPSDGATGDTITPATAAGTLAAWSFPATGGDYEPATGAGTIQLDGTLTFLSPPPGPPRVGGHGFTVSLTDPRVVLNGDGGQLFATGLTSGGAPGSAPVPYLGASPVFNLDLSDATVTLHADGSRTIAGIVPAIATANLVFPGYAAGAGPDRTPHTFGGFALRVRTAPVAGPQGPAGPQGQVGVQGKPGKDGKTIRLQTALLRKAPLADGKSHAIALLTTKGKQVAHGSVRSRTIRVQLADGRAKALRGVFLLKAGKAPAIRVRVI